MKCMNIDCVYHNSRMSGSCKKLDYDIIKDCPYYIPFQKEPAPELETPKPSTINGTRDIIRERLTSEQYFGWLLGNTIEASLSQNSSNTNILNAARIARYAGWMQAYLVEEAE